jgi:hypothetical protein
VQPSSPSPSSPSREAIADLIDTAQREQRPLRLHLREGEVVTVRVLDRDEHEVVYAPLTSSRPERYAVCDSTGFRVPMAEIERVFLV